MSGPSVLLWMAALALGGQDAVASKSAVVTGSSAPTAGSSPMDAGAPSVPALPRGVSPAPSGSSGKASHSAGGQDQSPRDVEAEKWKPVVGSRLRTGGDIHVGDPIEIRVTVVHDPKVSVNLPSVLFLGKDFDVVDQGQKTTETLDDGKVREEFWIKVVCFRVGDLVPHDIEVTYTYPGPGGGGTATVSTNPGVIKVTSVMANESNPRLKPDEGPVPVMEENRTAKYVLVALAALLLGALFGWFGYLLYRRRHKVGPPPVPPRPAHEIALEKLDAISKGSLLEEGRFKEFYFAVSEAVREYLGNRFGFDSLEMTTTELLDRLSRVRLEGVTLQEVSEFSQDCDLVKFTKYVPDREEAEKVLERAYEMVRSSMVLERQPLSGEEGGETSGAPSLQDDDGTEQEETVSKEGERDDEWAPGSNDGEGRP